MKNFTNFSLELFLFLSFLVFLYAIYRAEIHYLGHDRSIVYAKYFKSMLELGVYLPPSQYECLFLSSKIDEDDIKKIIDSNLNSLKKIM